MVSPQLSVGTDVGVGNTKTTPNNRSRAFTLTFFGKKKSRKDFVDLLKSTSDYGIAGNEKCPTTGKRHIQAFIYFKNPKRFKSIIKMYKGAHIEIMRGRLDQNETYCSKEGSYETWGKRPKVGARSDLSQVVTGIHDGTYRSILDLVESVPMVVARYDRFCTRLLCRYHRRTWQPEVVVHVGARRTLLEKVYTGTEYIYEGFWDNYHGDDVVIIPDFRERDWPFDKIVRLTDKWPLNLDVKYGSTPMLAKKIIILSADGLPDGWYQDIRPKQRDEWIKILTLA